jgi:hypothetical protein
MGPGSHVTLATSTGPIWLLILVHVLGGTVAILTGFVAVIVAKGSLLHRRAGLAFVAAMIVMGIFAAVVATYEAKISSIVGGILSAYFVFTGLTTVRPLAGTGRRQHLTLMAVPVVVALFDFTIGFIALGTPQRSLGGVPAGMILFIGTIALLAAIGDWRMIRAGGIAGTRKLARHLWRMCFALFIASGSFFLGQMRFIPAPLRIVPLLATIGVAPLVVLLYWMWRVRLRHSLRGMIIRNVGNAAARV